MLPELGTFSLILALCLALAQGLVPLVGSYYQKTSWMAAARPLAVGQFVFILSAYLILTFCFISNDFTVAYVAENSNIRLPFIYRICAVWGGHEGSLLLWVLILSVWMVAVCMFSRSLPQQTLARVLAVLSWIAVGFLLFLLATSNPFQRLFVHVSLTGADLNPVLQDPGLIFHPPMLYMGYVGFSVAFAFAITALLSGRLDVAWARWSRPWTTIAWSFLTLGITLGSWWAYRELGWGGWWFWDPVENASFMPWLVGTALIHSLAASEKRNTFKAWTVLLAICAFSLSLLGTFLVRSGVLTSVHAFATDPKRGVFILIFLVVVIGSSLTLYAWRVATMRAGNSFKLYSRETLLLINNVFLVVAAATVLLGTLYPLIIDALGLGKLSVGTPYFNTMFTLLMVPLLAVMPLGPLARWKATEPKRLIKQLWLILLLAFIIAGLLLWIIVNHIQLSVLLGVGLALWIIGGSLQSLASKVREKRRLWRTLKQFSRSHYGMLCAHIGIAVLVLGVTLTSAYHLERDVRMKPGDTVTLAGYTFTFMHEHDYQGQNYAAVAVTFRVNDNKRLIAVLTPEKRIYRANGVTKTVSAINATMFRDLYISLGEPLQGNAWAVRLYYKPFVRWIWYGGLLMLLGGLLAVSDKRYRKIKVTT
ncbi:MAG: heme lyase CcmF/NrfE family subunit [Gammaproteobacteria bacterium]|nr:heme lyase CcmF/NrfE family subunit [Gammaproteobacteria bacterium]